MPESFAATARQTFPTQQAFEAFARDFARGLRAGDVVALSGELGSGKTTFVRAAVRALHGEDQTSSPTFTFWHRYPGEPPVDHLDLYRVNDAAELRELGLEDALDGRSIAFIEWWTHAPALLPARRYEVHLEGSGEQPRTVEVKTPA
ncbi:MAG TPA: tRNA (adenosine(37)-N6)-threonylcarbamoyltransferase complex ATPase subunit type 1 TsaE [Candidatus Acidoferrales bacterium]|nr:tRNA (adenosine(37)-N6)-threonylcarbamoyltransferase complex ATPase subunit type 1 TsaE [Candidatus Acidoferrales bacterium]